jgi:hypothetical protein
MLVQQNVIVPDDEENMAGFIRHSSPIKPEQKVGTTRCSLVTLNTTSDS